jgi:hypothetical protein
MERCAVRWSMWANGAVALIGLGFVLPVVLIMVHTGSANDGTTWSGLVFFGLIALLFGRRTFDRRPTLTIDERGILLIRYGLISWPDISEVNITLSSPNVFAIRVHDLKKWQHQIPIFLRMGWQFFPKWRRLSVSLQNVDTSTAKIILAVERFLPKKADARGYVSFSRYTDESPEGIDSSTS